MLTQERIKPILRQAYHVRLNQFLDGKKYILGSIVLIGLFIVFMFNSFAVPTPVSSVVVQSTTLDYSKSEEGSWQYTKSAKWISKGKARINIKLETVEKSRTEYTDVILVLDVSGSMVGDKLTQVQRDVNALINDTIPKGNKIALITFSDEATVINDFTSDTTLLQESINGLVAAGETNYYQALVKVDDILSTYNKESNRDCVVLFLTDGLPTVDTPNEVGQYNYLKTKYEHLNINGIQYEFGDKVLEGVKSITDTQYLANKESLNEFLYKASISAANYDDFTLTDYIDEKYFNLENISNVDTTFGTTSIIDNRVVWNLKGLKSGLDAELTADINLNDDLVGVGGTYLTHEKADVTYKITSTSSTESSTKTPALSDNYIVSYDANTPAGCVVSNMPNQKNYSVFDNVKIEDTVPTCGGYQFKRWEIVTEDVKRVGDNYFIMPETNVTIKAIWKKLGLVKLMEGKVEKVQTLYKFMADNSKGVDTNSDFRYPETIASGIYTRNGTENDQYPVHYYRGNIDNNNVLFAGFCWKMVRTTSTGGVKLIYNGIYNDNDKCNNIGTASQIGKSRFNSNTNSPADVGYMYGVRYTYSGYGSGTVDVLEEYWKGFNSDYYYYGDSVTYSNGTYTLVNASQKTWSDNYSNLVGYYTCKAASSNCSTVYYIVGTTSYYLYVISLSGGTTDPATQTITLGKGMTDNGNGTYSLTQPITIEKKDWFTTYSTYKGYYICRDLASTTCENKNQITSTSNYQLSYDRTFNYIYGNDVSWDGSKYTLVDTFTSTNFWSTDKTTLAKKYHYTCFNTTGECTNVYYIHYFGNDTTIYYLTLSSGKDIENAKDEMFTNTNDSAIKKTIDNWYAANMTSYTGKLEDTIWCSERTLYSGSLAGKDEDAGTSYSTFLSNSATFNPKVTCVNEVRDGFTVSTTSGGNGALTYPVGLLTADEIRLAGGYGSSFYLYTGQIYWVLSPYSFSDFSAYGYVIDSYGRIVTTDTISYDSYGVRPSVSLAKGTRYMDGDGTVENPYVVE